MLKGLKVRIYPTKEQITYIDKLLGCYRYVFNSCLTKKSNDYKEFGTKHTFKSLGYYFHNELTKNPETPWINEHNTKVIKQAIIDLEDAFSRFFKKQNGYPQYKSKHENENSCRFPKEAISIVNKYEKNKFTLTSELKNIKYKCNKKYIKLLVKYNKDIKSATLTKTKSGKYFVSFLVNVDELKKVPEPVNDFIGIDIGINDFIVDSNGETYENLKVIRKNKKKLKHLYKKHSSKQKGSKNRNKARIRLARQYEKLTNLKQNHLHKISNSLINENQVICKEDLNVNGMMKNHKLAKSIQELSISEFFRMLDYKAKWYGRETVQIDRYFPSSKLCSSCGYKNNSLTLKDREWECPSCHVVHQRDYNSAINIENEGRRIYFESKYPTE